MEDYTYIEILIEDKSGGILVQQIMEKYIADKENVQYKIHSFKGIGKLPLTTNKISQIKTKKLLTDLPMYLKGIGASLKNMPCQKAIFVILDSDNEDCVELKSTLVHMYEKLDISVQVFFCIAVEEMEAWLLGDAEAVCTAYPEAKRPLLQKYVQDSIIGTWEYLTDVVYKGDIKALKKQGASYYEIGLFKCQCAKNIGSRLNIKKNNSQSFNYFISKLDAFCLKQE